MDRIKDQVIFVTGATGGIGGAIARQLAAAGAEVAVSGRNAQALDALRQELGDAAMAVAADATDESQVADAMGKARRHFGRLDTLINVPGMSVPAKLAEMDAGDFDRIFAVNVRTMFLCSKHFIQHLDADKGGLIVNISSVAGKAANPNAPAYCAAKAAVNMLSDGLQMQYKQANVRVSVISPGAVTTPGFWGDRPVPHDKFLTPDQVAQVVTFVVGLPESVLVQDVVFQPWHFFKGK